jgi:hypothetical protein
MPIFRVELRYNNMSMQAENVLYYRATEAATPYNMCQLVQSEFVPELLNCMSTKISLVDIRTIDTASLEEFTEPVGTAGSVQGDMLPPTNCALLRLITRFADRSRKGRVYLPGVPEGMQNEGVLSGELTILMGTLGLAMKSFTGLGMTADLIIHSRKTLANTDVEAVIPHNYVCTQRRRGYGRGS